jgi:hypothetical protein
LYPKRLLTVRLLTTNHLDTFKMLTRNRQRKADRNADAALSQK